MSEQDTVQLPKRDRILRAAMELFGEDPGAGLSVRLVAARAGVSTGSLRHHFPTQRILQDTVLTTVYDLAFSDDPIHDQSAAARERLVECLRMVLAHVGVGEQARQSWMKWFQSGIAAEPTDDRRQAHLAGEREERRRVEYWLTVLAEEGSMPKGDNTRRAQFLLVVLNGLALQRALPAQESILTSETHTLYAAADSVLGAHLW